MSDYELLQDVTVGAKPRESKETESAGLDHSSVAKAVEHGRPDALGARGAFQLQRMAGNAAMGSLVQREAQESPVKDIVGKGGGTALDEGLRKPFEQKIGADFSDVRIHTGAKASEAATSVQSKAFTSGTDIVFNGDNFQPGTPEGQQMLAHELTHVKQQKSGDVPGESREGGVKVSDPGDWAEREAEATAQSVVPASGLDHAGHDHGGGGASGGGVQREAEDDVQTMRDPSIQREAESGEAEEEELQTMHDASIQREAGEEEEELQTMHDTSIQREAGEEEEELQTVQDPSIQREAESGEAEEEELQTMHDPSIQRDEEVEAEAEEG